MNKPINSNRTEVEREALRYLSVYFLSSLKPSTRKAYSVDLESFSVFLGASCVSDATVLFVSLPQGKANLTALEWRTYLREEGLAPSSINRRLAALRSLVSFARMLGLINYELSVKNYKATSYKNVRGPGQTAFNKMLEYVSSKKSKQFIRDKAMLVLFHDLGLRRAELSQLY